MLRQARQKREPTIALINIVFLMLVFFMVAGTLARPLEGGLTLVQTAGLEGRSPPDALVLHPDGRLSFQGRDTNVTDYVGALAEADKATLRIVPDRALPAWQLVAISRDLRAAGAGRIMIVTERGLP